MPAVAWVAFAAASWPFAVSTLLRDDIQEAQRVRAAFDLQPIPETVSFFSAGLSEPVVDGKPEEQ